MGVEIQALIRKTLNASDKPQGLTFDIAIPAKKVSHERCNGGFQVSLTPAAIYYKNEEDFVDDPTAHYPEEVLIMSDADFLKQELAEVSLVYSDEGGTPQQLKKSFLDTACNKAGCVGGANCLKRRSMLESKSK